MSDDFQIVFEAPQDGQTRKKRARLVTSCDHCRLKKIKCVQTRTSKKCEACTTARVACRFRDREQYFAERGRMMAQNTPSSSSHKTKAADRHISISIMDAQGHFSSSPSTDSGPSSPDESSHLASSYLAASAPSFRPTDYIDARSLSEPTQLSWNAGDLRPSVVFPPTGFEEDHFSYAPSEPPSFNPSSMMLPLFDPQWPDRPHPTLMLHFIQTYFDHYGQSFPCLAYDETVRQFLEQSLSPLIAAGIAALAAWYSDLPEVVRRGAADVSGAYCSHAKALLSRSPEHYTIEMIHGLILLAWAEYKRARMPDFCAHVTKAKRIADKLGLANGSLIAVASNDYERNILRSTLGLVRQLVTTVETWSG